jgi:hypothetical protein
VKRVLALVSAPLLMYLLAAVERRRGAALAGLLGAAPFTIVLVVAGTGDTEIARHAGAHVVAQVPFFLVLAALARRGLPVALLAATAVFAAVSLAAGAAGLLAATVAGAIALLFGARAPSSTTPGGETQRSPALGAAVATGLVGLTMVAAALAGPAAAGTVAAFPALSGAFALSLARARGPEAAAAALHGGVRGLRSYLAFCLVTPFLGVVAGLAVALAVTAAGSGMLRLERPLTPAAAR